MIGNPMVPGEMIPLTLDPAGTKPGPVIRPGVTLSVLDGDLQPDYNVAPTDPVPMIRRSTRVTGPVLSVARWGLGSREARPSHAPQEPD